MAEKLPFGEGASINRPPLLCGLNYQFSKVRMKILLNLLIKEFGMKLKMVLLFPNLKNMDLPLKNLGPNGLILKTRRPNLIVLLRTL